MMLGFLYYSCKFKREKYDYCFPFFLSFPKLMYPDCTIYFKTKRLVICMEQRKMAHLNNLSNCLPKQFLLSLSR